MKREIKFRAWHEDAKEYCECETSHMFRLVEEGHPVQIEQFTGLHDFNGVEIYEWDVVTIKDYDDGDYYMTGVVKFGVRGYPAFEVYDVNGNQYTDEYNSLTNDELKIEIIGNIHQNPELLGGAK